MRQPHPLFLVLSVVVLNAVGPGGLRADEAPVPVIREPHHRVALENAYVRTLDVHLAPGEQTLYHAHRLPTVVVELSRSTITSQEWKGPAPAARDVAPGDTRYAAYDEQPLLHQVANRGSAPFHVMDIELLQPNVEPKDGFPPLLPSPARLEYQKKQVRAYRLALGPAERIAVPATPAAYLLIVYAGQLGSKTSGEPIRIVRAGEEAFAAPETALTVANGGGASAGAILFELETTAPLLK